VGDAKRHDAGGTRRTLTRRTLTRRPATAAPRLGRILPLPVRSIHIRRATILPRCARLAPVIAHRGASADAPENTVAAMLRAADDGVQAVEIDVNISADGVPYVHHDERLQRCTGHPGRLHEQPSRVLDALHAGAGMPGFEIEPLARLETLLGVVIGRRLALNLEIKAPPGRERVTTQAICDVLERCWPSDRTLVFSSFSATALQCAAERLPELPRALLVGRLPADWQQTLEHARAVNLHCAARHVDPTVAARVADQGHGLYCFTVNEPDRAIELLAGGVHGVFTDVPARLLAAIRASAAATDR